ncbi:hypothetical protein FH972_010739 [Carpinus fangiana]|uniref:Uncharacterized protein n=1 Tax=Carpinus fangiana TaxID=176857 RepID=A0A660KS19_9ROSI|nr:hypothetical protein FH972_010739 [Carpinus fangiana]
MERRPKPPTTTDPLSPPIFHFRHRTPPAHHHRRCPPTETARIRRNQNGSTNVVFLFDFENG